MTDMQEGSTVSSLICDHWWHLKLVAHECQGQASVRLKDGIVQFGILLG